MNIDIIIQNLKKNKKHKKIDILILQLFSEQIVQQQNLTSWKSLTMRKNVMYVHGGLKSQKKCNLRKPHYFHQSFRFYRMNMPKEMMKKFCFFKKRLIKYFFCSLCDAKVFQFNLLLTEYYCYSIFYLFYLKILFAKHSCKF